MKKNKNIITAILVFTLVATGIYSCSDEYLDETDNYNIDFYICTCSNILLYNILISNMYLQQGTNVAGFFTGTKKGHVELNIE